jgi:hypothetical protein
MLGLRPGKILNLMLEELYEKHAVRHMFCVPIQHMLQKVPASYSRIKLSWVELRTRYSCQSLMKIEFSR